MDRIAKTKEQAVAEAQIDGFRHELGPFVVAAETTRMPMAFTDATTAGNPIVFVNQSFVDLTGYGEDELLARDFTFLMARGADPDTLMEIQTAFLGGRGLETQVQFRRNDGRFIWVSIFVNPVRNRFGEVVQHFASFIDITRHKDAEDRLNVLLHNAYHRTQNVLGTVLAIADQTLRDMADANAASSFKGRILALSRAHSLLGGASWDRVELGDVIERMLQPFGLRDREGSRFTILGEDVGVEPPVALTMALVFHELATNAAKYGALLTDAGRISVAWSLEPSPDGKTLRLRWQESGGPTVVRPTHRGFGSWLLRGGLKQGGLFRGRLNHGELTREGSAQELNGEEQLDFAAEGVSYQLVLQLP